MVIWQVTLSLLLEPVQWIRQRCQRQPVAGSLSRRKARVAVIYKLQQLCNTPEVKATGSPATAQLE